MRKKLLISLICLICTIFAALGITANAETPGGSCGADVEWELDTNTGVLTISGNGDMENYILDTDFPWHSYRSSIKTIKIEEGVTSIDGSAFARCTNLTNIVIPESIVSIGGSAFEYCTALTSITIPDSVTIIQGSVFYECDSLENITIPDGVTSIGTFAFYGCNNLKSITIPDEVTSIGYAAFSNCWNLTSVVIPDGVTAIESNTFYNCYRLESILLSDSITEIGQNAFKSCTVLTDLTLPAGLTSIGNYAFERCDGLTSITIPDSVVSIGNYAFWYCNGFESVEIPKSVTSIGSNAFSGCNKLSSITVAAANQYYSSQDGILFDKSGEKLIFCPQGKLLTSYTVPDTVTSIDWFAFENFNNLTSITLSSGVTSIGNCAFRNCTNLMNITIPNTVTSIGYAAFDGCDNITNIYYGGTSRQWMSIHREDGNSSLNKAIVFWDETPDGATPSVIECTVDKTSDSSVLIRISTRTLSEPCVILVALYNGGRFSQMKEVDLDETGAGKAEFNITNENSFKVFAWDSLNSLSPLCDAVGNTM